MLSGGGSEVAQGCEARGGGGLSGSSRSRERRLRPGACLVAVAVGVVASSSSSSSSCCWRRHRKEVAPHPQGASRCCLSRRGRGGRVWPLRSERRACGAGWEGVKREKYFFLKKREGGERERERKKKAGVENGFFEPELETRRKTLFQSPLCSHSPRPFQGQGPIGTRRAGFHELIAIGKRIQKGPEPLRRAPHLVFIPAANAAAAAAGTLPLPT